MEDDKKSDAPAAEPSAEEAKPKMVEVEQDYLDDLEARSFRLAKMLDRPKRPLLIRDLEARASILSAVGPDEWGNHGPGVFLLPRCGHYKGSEAIYFRGTVGLRCRVCKTMSHRFQVAESRPETVPGPTPETSTEEAGIAVTVSRVTPEPPREP